MSIGSGVAAAGSHVRQRPFRATAPRILGQVNRPPGWKSFLVRPFFLAFRVPICSMQQTRFEAPVAHEPRGLGVPPSKAHAKNPAMQRRNAPRTRKYWRTYLFY